MQKMAKALCLAASAGLSIASTAARADDPPEHSFTGKVAVYSEYEYRGISQTSEKPALSRASRLLLADFTFVIHPHRRRPEDQQRQHKSDEQ